MVDKALQQSESEPPVLQAPAIKSDYADGFDHATRIIIFEFLKPEVKRKRSEWIEWMKTINSAMPKADY